MGAEALAALFGVYGDVARIKMLPEQEAALVEMEKPVQAYVAKWLLDASPLGGRIIKVGEREKYRECVFGMCMCVKGWVWRWTLVCQWRLRCFETPPNQPNPHKTPHPLPTPTHKHPHTQHR